MRVLVSDKPEGVLLTIYKGKTNLNILHDDWSECLDNIMTLRNLGYEVEYG